MSLLEENASTYRDENVQKVLQRWQLRDELLDDFTEGLEYGVVVDAGEVEAREAMRKKSIRDSTCLTHCYTCSAGFL